MDINFFAAFTLGLFSAVHCWGMCGGIITALALNLPSSVRENRRLSATYVLAYNLGRISSYTLAGLLVGAASQLIFSQLRPLVMHQIMVWFSSVILILLGLYIAGWFPALNRVERLGTRLWKYLQPLGKGLIPVKTPLHAYAFGLIWGWLPCGLVYSALVFAMSAGTASGAAIYMLLYGLGTLPAVMGAGLLTGTNQRFMKTPAVRRVLGLLLIGFALWNLYGLHAGDHAQHGHPATQGSDGLEVTQPDKAMDHAHHH